jgi:predicted amidohydrolase YtcJ
MARWDPAPRRFYAEFTDDRKVRLKSGYHADFIVLSKPIFDVAPRELLDTKVQITVVGGRIVYEERQ